MSKTSFVSIVEKMVGQKIAVLCARYQYRGVLSQVTNECIALANATAVETSGPSMGAAPPTEDPIGSTVIIKNDAIEIVYQPNWCNAKLPNE